MQATATVTRVILSRLADAPRFFAAGGALSVVTVYTGQADVYLCSIEEKSAITRARVFYLKYVPIIGIEGGEGGGRAR